MVRTGLIAALALLLVPASAAAAGPASVSLTACAPKERAAEFEARMDQISGAVRMKLRYSLEARKPGRAWRRVVAPELAGWRTAAPETTRFISERRVTELTGPSHYRALVRFRWIDEQGETVARATRRSRTCWQPDHRPNLKPRELLLEDGGRYLVLVANTGRSASGAFDLEISGLPPLVVDDLEPGEERWVEATGPQCEPGHVITATADPLDLVDERNERDNALRVRCSSA
jgi:CARDB